MTNHTDILLDENYNLLAKNGDLVTGDMLIQQQALLLSTGEGEWKQSPVVGVSLNSFLLDESELEAFRRIRIQFKSDGVLITKLKKQSDGNLLIEAQHA